MNQMLCALVNLLLTSLQNMALKTQEIQMQISRRFNDFINDVRVTDRTEEMYIFGLFMTYLHVAILDIIVC